MAAQRKTGKCFAGFLLKWRRHVDAGIEGNSERPTLGPENSIKNDGK